MAASDILNHPGIWKNSQHSNGFCRWSTGDLGNGWAAVVTDNSQQGQGSTCPTYYYAECVSTSERWLMKSHRNAEGVLQPTRFAVFEVAKAEALQMALEQKANLEKAA